MRKSIVTIVKFLISGLIIFSSLYFLQRLLVPKYATEIVEGAMISEYYQEEKEHDLIFIGDCEVYENFSPQILWDDFGINSYIRESKEYPELWNLAGAAIEDGHLKIEGTVDDGRVGISYADISIKYQDGVWIRIDGQI